MNKHTFPKAITPEATGERIPFKSFMILVLLYWRSQDATVKKSLLFLVLSMLLIILVVGTNVYLNQLSGDFMSAIQHYAKETIIHLSLILICLFTLFSIMSAYQNYIFALMQIRWRNWLTHYCVSHWLNQQNFYQLETFNAKIDNPDQRISEDVANLIGIFSGLVLGVLNSILTLGSFGVILWTLSSPINLSIGGHAFTIYGDMLWAAMIYSIISTYLTFIIGRPIINLSFWQQRFEAYFRYNLVRIRENCEAIAMYHGEQKEHQTLREKFDRVVGNFISLARRQRRLDMLTGFIDYINNFIPTIIALPGYFAKRYDMGGISRITQAFNVVNKALGFFIVNYVQIAQIIATSQRLHALLQLNGKPNDIKAPQNLQIKYQNKKLSAENLQLFKPSGELMLGPLNFAIAAGEHTLIMGASGSGKSTLLRTIANIWPFATGTLIKPSEELLFIPQKPYLPEGNLRDILIFPNINDFDEAKIKTILTKVQLGHLLPELNEIHNWSQKLSLGEQQRLSFARALLHEPKWLLLDEATSAVDEDLEQNLYQLLLDYLPKTTFISVGHRSTLKAFHPHILELKKA
jgi:putative ATP-binding cassette transporter